MFPLLQDNGATLAGYGMVASWGVGVLVALYTLIALLQARFGQRRGGVSLVGLTNWCALFAVGVVTATTVRGKERETKGGTRREREAEADQKLGERCDKGILRSTNLYTETDKRRKSENEIVLQGR